LLLEIRLTAMSFINHYQTILFFYKLHHTDDVLTDNVTASYLFIVVEDHSGL